MINKEKIFIKIASSYPVTIISGILVFICIYLITEADPPLICGIIGLLSLLIFAMGFSYRVIEYLGDTLFSAEKYQNERVKHTEQK